MGKIKIKRDDQVLVIAGEHKGSKGKVIKVIRDQNKAIIEGTNLIKKTRQAQCTKSPRRNY